ncbi:MAG: tRNA (adenosine(37)-N6)-threonylcarbamoyltransferase complex dimerization subunit type 1 TsaB [bacterium]
MLVLGIETSSAIGGFAIVDGEKLLVEIVAEMSASHVEKSISLISHLLNREGLEIDDLEGIAVSLGPGSFTGLRVGLSLAKGFCFGRKTPLVGVPTLDCIANLLRPWEGKILVVRDARCGEVFSCFYRGEGQRIQRLTEYLSLTPQSVIDMANSMEIERLIVTGDGLKLYRSQFECLLARGAVIAPQSLWLPRPGTLASMGASDLAAGEISDIDSIEPLYVRPSEAERKHGGACQ